MLAASDSNYFYISFSLFALSITAICYMPLRRECRSMAHLIEAVYEMGIKSYS